MKFHEIRAFDPIESQNFTLGAWDAEVHLLYGCHRSGVHGGLPSSQRGTEALEHLVGELGFHGDFMGFHGDFGI
jgi:hypothetical protein